MKLFPPMVVDDFYENVDAVREFALSCPFNVTNPVYPGKRTESLHTISPKFFDYCSSKLLSLYYDFNTPVNWTITTSFQLIEPYSNEKMNIKNMGWIHKDLESVFAGILYLTPDADPDTGTRIYKLKNGITDEDADTPQAEKHKLYGEGKMSDAYTKEFTTHRSHFEETINIKNYYNRLLTFGAHCYHGVETVYNKTPRLTQVFFVKEISASVKAPLVRMNEYKVTL